MIEAMNKLRKRAVAVLIIEVLLLVFINLGYFLDIAGLHAFFTPLRIFIISVVLVFINLLIFLFLSLHINKIRKKNTFQLVNLLGADVKEAYDFGMVGVIVVDKDFNVKIGRAHV